MTRKGTRFLACFPIAFKFFPELLRFTSDLHLSSSTLKSWSPHKICAFSKSDIASRAKRALRASESGLKSIRTGSQTDTGMLFQMHQSPNEKSNANERRSIHETMILAIMVPVAKNGQEGITKSYRRS
ncbi:uncharacterized protein Bfra_002765 [Botrytis fragariae]|uniref:Uncharacterized protein n=1 Tax=Botrytis fragariae TaxID=1964551 RepID=A0A8H6ELJ3_9HELO|nr:uncharacterized protein Bfra_002765 [Botrytis fragariae]KAF5876360.1 hypothetical protein Bfra_002765 [Botrytis fragariae]